MKCTIIYSLLAIIMLVGHLVSAQSIDWSIPNLNAVRGDTLLVPVQMTTNPSAYGIVSFDAEVRILKTQGTFLGIVTTGTLAEDLGSVAHHVASRANYWHLEVSAAGVSPLTTPGVLFYMKIISHFSVGMQFTGVNIVNEGDPTIILSDGTISAVAPPSISVSPNTGELIIGETMQFTASNAHEPLTWTVSDGLLASIDTAGQLTAIDQGIVQVRAVDSAGTADWSGDIAIRSLGLEIDDVAATAGDTIQVPVRLQNPSQTPIAAGQFRVLFSTSRWTVLGLETTGTDLDDAFVESTVDSSGINGHLTVSFAESTPAVGDSILVYLSMYLSISTSNGSTVLSADDVLFNESLMARVEGGLTSYTATPSLHVTPSSIQDLAIGSVQTFTVSGGAPPYTWTVTNPEMGILRVDGRFIARSPGEGYVEVVDQQGLIGRSGLIRVQDADLYFDVLCASANDTVWLPIMLSELPNNQVVTSFEVSVEYSTPELEYIGYDRTNSATDGWLVVDEPIDGDEFQLVAAGVNGTRGGGALIYLGFRTTSSLTNNELAAVSLSSYLLNEGQPSVDHHPGGVRRRSHEMTDVTVTQISPCDTSTGTYAIDVTLSYINPPTSGSLIVNGQSYPITTSPQTVTLSDLQADGQEKSILASFSSASCGHYYEALYTAPGCQRDIIFVDHLSQGLNDGTSWHNAYKRLEDALAMASTMPSPQVWVAAGTYTFHEQAPPTTTFDIPDDTHVIGRFEGYESRLHHRTMDSTLVTSLSGNASIPTYHVVTRSTGTMPSILQDVTITEGHATGAGQHGKGGGLYNEGPMILRGVRFIDNSATQGGAAIYNKASSTCHLMMSDVQVSSAIPTGDGPLLIDAGTELDMIDVDIQP